MRTWLFQMLNFCFKIEKSVDQFYSFLHGNNATKKGSKYDFETIKMCYSSGFVDCVCGLVDLSDDKTEPLAARKTERVSFGIEDASLNETI